MHRSPFRSSEQGQASDVSSGSRPAKTGAGSSDQVAKNGCCEPRWQMRSPGASRLQHCLSSAVFLALYACISVCIVLALPQHHSTHHSSACLRDQGRPTTIGRPVAVGPTTHDPDPDPAPPRDVAPRLEALDLPHLDVTAEPETAGVAASLGVGAEMTGRAASAAAAAALAAAPAARVL